MTPPVLRVGLIGHGTVGQSFAHHLAASAPRLEARTGVRFRLTRVAVCRPDVVRPQLADVRVTDDAASVAIDPTVDLLVEASGARSADAWLTIALDRGCAAITANTQAVARSPRLLRALADRHPLFRCEATVAAAIPIVRALRDSVEGEEVLNLRGVLNGTSTFVLDRVEHGADWHAAIAEAQSLGLAEHGGAADFDGSDAAARLAILATTAWRTPITRDRVRVRGLDERLVPAVRAAFGEGRRLRLVAEAWSTAGTHLLVEPRVLEGTDPISTVTDGTNAIELNAVLAGQLCWFGPGAGGGRTASALLADLAAAARELVRTQQGRAAA